MKLKDYFTKQNVPERVLNYKKGLKFDINKVLSYPTLYYAGAGFDGEAISIFNKTNHFHTFIYVDYGNSLETITNELGAVNAFNGYHLIDLKVISENELVPNGWVSHHSYTEREMSDIKIFTSRMGKPFTLLGIYERDEDKSEEHGAKRFAVIYIGGDAIATYDALFINNHLKPTVFYLRDHGFGGNYNKYGKGGLLDDLMEKYDSYPEYVFTEQSWNVRNGYIKEENVNPEGRQIMFLYKRK